VTNNKHYSLSLDAVTLTEEEIYSVET